MEISQRTNTATATYQSTFTAKPAPNKTSARSKSRSVAPMIASLSAGAAGLRNRAGTRIGVCARFGVGLLVVDRRTDVVAGIAIDHDPAECEEPDQKRQGSN